MKSTYYRAEVFQKPDSRTTRDQICQPGLIDIEFYNTLASAQKFISEKEDTAAYWRISKITVEVLSERK